MTSFNTLPYEIRQLILQHIDSTKQLGECRRISKIWDKPAECAMFSRQLCITPENIRSLYVRLLTKPSLAKCIKDIQLDSRGFTEFMASFLRLAITPNIERITSDGFKLDIRFYQTMNEMVRDSGVRLQRLKSIPWPDFLADIHYQTAHLLKDSLEEFTISSTHLGRRHELSTQLGECKYLSKLQFKSCSFDTLPRMESIFSDASHLMEVNLQDCGFDQGNVWTREERLRWMKQYVKINQNAIALKVVGGRYLSFPLIEYFLVKYPNMKQFDYKTSTDIRDLGGVDDNVEISRQACSWISRIPKYTMILNSRHEWRTHYESFAGGKNTFQLHYGERHTNKKSHVSSIVEQDGERTTHFEFWVKDIYAYDFFDTHVTFLRKISGFTTGLHLHFVNYHAPRSRVFFRALEVMNRLEDMRFSSPDSLYSVKLDLPSQYSERRLNTLEINDATLQPKVFNTLDRLFDTISTLKLSSFPIVDTNRKVKVSRYLIQKDDTDTFCIHMPSTAIGKLILDTESGATSSSDYNHYHASESKDKFILATEAYLIINLQQKIPLYFKLWPFRSDAHQISLQEYSNRPEFAHTFPGFVHAFKIDCLMLASIELHLGDIHATIDVQKYCE